MQPMASRPDVPKGERTRRRIIRTSIRLVSKHGFSDTSFQMIADSLGLSQSAVLYHFGSKNGLVEEIVKTIIRHNHELVGGLMRLTDNAGQRLLKHCFGNVLWALRRKDDAQILILLYYLACFEPAFTELFSKMMQGGRERLMVHLLAGQREGLFQLREEPAMAAEILQDTLFGAMLYATSAPEGGVAAERIEAKCRQVVSAHTGWTDPAAGAGLLAEAGLLARGRGSS